MRLDVLQRLLSHTVLPMIAVAVVSVVKCLDLERNIPVRDKAKSRAQEYFEEKGMNEFRPFRASDYIKNFDS